MLLCDPASGRSVRLNAPAYALVARLDGRHTVQQLWDWQIDRGDEPATQDEFIDMLAQLREASLVQFDRAADFEQMLPHLERVSAPAGRASLLAWRLPLANPSALLDRWQGLAKLLFSRAGLVAWSLALATLLVLLVQHGPTLWAHGERWLATPRFALLALLLYAPVKLLHELGHALAVHRWGGQVHEAGVTLMLGLPMPYVDASAASAFARRRHRLAVSAAGLMAELALAALALPLWLWLDDGLGRDAAFATLAIAGASTLLLNANPLQRLDGYHMLTDALELPNLATRSRSWWLLWLQRRLLRAPGLEPMAVARGETPWLAAYAPLSWACSLVVAALAVVWLGHLSFAAGMGGAALMGWQLLARPAARLLSDLRRTALGSAGTASRWRRLAFAGLAAGAVALFLPLPQRLLVQGVVWPADEAQLRAEEGGFVLAVHADDGQQVQAGALVLQLASPSLATSLARQQSRVDALEAELFDAMPGVGAAAGNTRAELAAAQAELGRLQERFAALEVRAHTAGRIALPHAADLPGQFVRRGHLLGQVIGPHAGMVRLALPQSQTDGLQPGRQVATVQLASTGAAPLRATLVRDAVGATMQLPSAALSTRHGGSIQTDPADADDLKPLHPVVVLEVRFDESPGSGRERMGERAWVRLDAGFAPLALQLVRAARREVLRRFNPQF